MNSSLLFELNHAAIWQRAIKVWDCRVRAASLDRLVFLALHRAGVMGKEEAELLKKLVTPGMQILDVGANIGLYTLLLSRLTGKTGRVFAFEPEPNLFSILCENCAANQASNVTPFQCAAGEANGRATFQRATFNSGDNRLGASKSGAESIEVEVARLDEVLPVRTVDFIKLDVQGHELSALTGMQQLLASSPEVRVLFEFWPAGLRAANASPELLFKFFHDRDFLIHALEGGRPRQLDAPATLVEKLGAKRYTNLLASRKPLATL
jgi:FkbM family methyltransferase